MSARSLRVDDSGSTTPTSWAASITSRQTGRSPSKLLASQTATAHENRGLDVVKRDGHARRRRPDRQREARAHPLVQTSIPAIGEGIVREALGLRELARYGMQIESIAQQRCERPPDRGSAGARLGVRVRSEVAVQVTGDQAPLDVADVERLVGRRLELKISPGLLFAVEGVQAGSCEDMPRSIRDRPSLTRDRGDGVDGEVCSES